MRFDAPDHVGPYEILEPVGAGGMGEVYRARDPKLQRIVALKVLPELFARDSDRLARFEREAQVLAALNHPHIAQIYGVEESGPVRALVMEFVEGPTLADVCPRPSTSPAASAGPAREGSSPLPVTEALQIARQIADALEAAHAQGIIHRDLKPANIKVKPDGTVKVLDFGLAKAFDQSGSAGEHLANSPTFTSPAMMTGAGVILGTAAYMSPEQARGRALDRRADLWAFGVVLYEMLTGRQAFSGETVTDVLAAVVREDPDWSALPADTPPGIRRLLRRCLERDLRRRLGDAGEARFATEEALDPVAAPIASAGGSVAQVATSAPRRRIALWTVAALVGFTVVASGIAWRLGGSTTPHPMRFSLELPPKTTLNVINRPAVTISPDGGTVVFVADLDGTSRLYVRRSNDFEARALQGTEDATNPVFSPDGRWLAFVANAQLGKIPLAGGPVTQLAPVNDCRGVSWGDDDVLTYSPDATGAVFRIPARGGTPTEVTKLDTKRAERTHRWPQALPGAKAILFTVGSMNSPDSYEAARIEAHVVATGERRLLLEGASMARYAPGGYLVFSRQRALYAVPFDPERLQVTGTPVPLLHGVSGDATTGAVHFAFSNTGTLAYLPGSVEGLQHRLMWFDAVGRTETLDLPLGMIWDPRLSPDGQRLAMVIAAGGGADVWVHDLVRRTETRLTFGGTHASPAWSPDGQTVYYSALSPNGQNGSIMRRPADGSRDADVVTTFDARIYIQQVSAFGTATIDIITPTNQTDIGRIRLERHARPEPLVSSRFDEFAGRLSPDGRWLAYQANEAGRPEVYVRSLAPDGGRWQVSSRGGEEPRWAADGRTLYFRVGSQLMEAPIEAGPAFQLGTPKVVFDGLLSVRTESGITYDVHPTQKRFLALSFADGSVGLSNIRIVVNWFRELRAALENQ